MMPIMKGARPDAVDAAISSLTREELEAFVATAATTLYWDPDANRWDGGKEWASIDFLDMIAQTLPNSICSAVDTLTKEHEADERAARR